MAANALAMLALQRPSPPDADHSNLLPGDHIAVTCN